MKSQAFARQRGWSLEGLPHCVSTAITAETEEPQSPFPSSPFPASPPAEKRHAAFAASGNSPALTKSGKRLRKPKKRSFSYEECNRARSKEELKALKEEVAKEQATPVAAVRFVAVIKREPPIGLFISELFKPCLLTWLLLTKFAIPIDEAADRASVDFVLLLCFSASDDVGLESVFDLLDVYTTLCFGLLFLSTVWTGVAQIADRNFPAKAMDENMFWVFVALVTLLNGGYFLLIYWLRRRVLQVTLGQSAAPGWDLLGLDSSRGGGSK